ncbi:MAG: DUF1501 domain-containing protein [Myxococcales bacterium FL481]|nr:MAG: DUF1501 domain-containing protein [Myxococcales bacterium FL481]
MERRDFLKLAGLAGFSVVPFASADDDRRQPSRSYAGPFFVMVNAAGGWDPTLLCDPKGRLTETDPDPINEYFVDEILTAGNIRYAPVGGNQAFFDKHFQRLLVLNGVDMQTNGHDSGARNCWSGSLNEGFPSFGAFVAAHHGPTLPMSYLSFGGYDETAGIVARTRSGNVNALQRLAYPERINTNDEESTFHSPRALQLIEQTRRSREQAQLAGQRLPRLQGAMNLLFAGRTGANELKLLQEYLPDQLSNVNLERQAQLAVAAYRAGISVSANISMGGFDTHGNHDAQHIPRLQTLLEGVDFLWEEAGRQGVADRLVIAVGSDFGRTPGYNDGQGKDHWSIGSYMLMGSGVVGNRVIGATDDRQGLRTIDPGSLAVVDGGARIMPEHVHAALRQLAAIDQTELAAAWPVAPETPLPGLLG